MRGALLAFLPLGLWAAAVLAIGSLELGGVASLPAGADKAAHFALYGVGGLCAVWAHRVRGRRAGLAGLMAVLLTGLVDELHQGTLPTRQSDFWDWAADAAGAGSVFLAVRALLPERDRSR